MPMYIAIPPLLHTPGVEGDVAEDHVGEDPDAVDLVEVTHVEARRVDVMVTPHEAFMAIQPWHHPMDVHTLNCHIPEVVDVVGWADDFIPPFNHSLIHLLNGGELAERCAVFGVEFQYIRMPEVRVTYDEGVM